VTVTRVARTATPTVAKPAALSGRIAYSLVTDPAPRLHAIYVANIDGTGATKILDYAAWPAFSPTGKNIAFFQLPGGGKNEGLYVASNFGDNPVPAYINPGVCCIDWSRDGNWIVFTSSLKPKQPGGSILTVKADGSYKTVVDLKVVGNGPTFSPDGKQVAFSGCMPGTNTCGIMVTPADGSGGQRAMTRDNGGNPHWSPRGDKIVYMATDDAGHNQVFIVNPDGSGKKQLTNGKSNDGQPVWSRDGGSILWRSDQNGTAWGIFAMNADGTNQRRILNNVPPDPDLWGWESLTVAP
jgi:Tol biopolymer transport system component